MQPVNPLQQVNAAMIQRQVQELEAMRTATAVYAAIIPGPSGDVAGNSSADLDELDRAAAYAVLAAQRLLLAFHRRPAS